MRGRVRTAAVAAGGATAAALALAATTITAGAVSGGGYSYQQQGCTATADNHDAASQAQPGCHSTSLQVNQGGGTYTSNWHVLSINTDQVPDGTATHSGTVVVDPGQGTAYTVTYDTGTGHTLGFFPLGFAVDMLGWVIGGAQGPLPIPQHPIGTIAAPSAGTSSSASGGHLILAHPGRVQLYFGMDDNVDNGEHDGINPALNNGQDAAAANGPSDGGAFQLNTHFQGHLRQPASLAQNVAPLDGHNPVRAADFGMGFCADGLCAAADTMQRTVYRGGCTDCPSQDVYDDQHSTNWRSPNCNSGDDTSQESCGSGWRTGSDAGPITQPYYERGAYTTEPGVMVYEDPDPQASPLLPMYPICELYVGTEGVYACSTQRAPSPAGVATSTTSSSPSVGTTTTPAPAPTATLSGTTTAIAPAPLPK